MCYLPVTYRSAPPAAQREMRPRVTVSKSVACEAIDEPDKGQTYRENKNKGCQAGASFVAFEVAPRRAERLKTTVDTGAKRLPLFFAAAIVQ